MKISRIDKWWWVALVLCQVAFSSVKAQNTPYDSSYVKVFEDKLLVAPFLSVRSFNVYFKPEDSNEDLMQFYPNVSTVFGVQLALKNLGLGLGLRLPLAEFNANNYGKTKYLDLNLQVVKPQFIIEGAFKDYKGMVDLQSEQYYLPNQFYVREDLKTNYLKFNYIHIFNHKKFSYRSAFMFREKQVKSAGSALAIANFSHFRMKADSAFLPNQMRNRFEEVATLDRFRVTGLGLGGGYVHSFVLNDFFITLFGVTGLEFKGVKYDLANDDGKRKEPQVTPLFDLRVSLGYNAPRWALGLVAQNDFNFFRMQAIEGRSVYSTVSLYVGWRFNAPQVLRNFDPKKVLQRKK